MKHPFGRAILERDLRARSQVARFAILHEREDWLQTTLPIAPPARPAANEPAEACGHAGTGRVPQKRLFGAGWATVCVRCGREV